MEKQLPAVVARLMRGELEAQQSDGRSDRPVSPKGAQKSSKLICLFWDLPLKRLVTQNQPRLADLVVLVMRLENVGGVFH